MATTTSKQNIAQTMSLLDEHKDSIPEGLYLQLANALMVNHNTGDHYKLELRNEVLKEMLIEEQDAHKTLKVKYDLLHKMWFDSLARKMHYKDKWKLLKQKLKLL